MDFSDAIKRKKRKTRKYLDEIRKRSRGNNDKTVVNSYNKVQSDKTTATSHSNHSNYLASNRLTLAMFPKAVRSETITRPALLEPDDDNDDDIEILSSSNGDIEGGSTFSSRQHDIAQNRSTGSTINENFISENMPTNFIAFNPVDYTANIAIESSDENIQTVRLSSSTESVQREYEYRRYKEFMNEIPMYLERSAPYLVNDNIMKPMIQLLLKVSLKCFNQRGDALTNLNKDNMCHPIISTHDTIIENPRNYIRWRQRQPEDMFEVNRPLSSGSISISSPCSSLYDPSSSTEGATILKDTPNYEYYPHKLNE